MAWTNKQAFNFGFLARCVEEGLDEDQIRDRTKLAHFVMGQEKKADGSVLSNLSRFATSLPALGLIGAGVGGAGIGYGLGILGGGTPRDPSELKMEELANAYRQHAERARRETKRRRRRKVTPPPRAMRLVG